MNINNEGPEKGCSDQVVSWKRETEDKGRCQALWAQ
jgi:hypothetical protein